MVTVKDTVTTFYGLCLFFLCCGVKGQGHICKQLDACRCQFTDSGLVVDISSVGKSDGTPRFKDVMSEDGYVYSFNPCKPFDEGTCKNAAVCKKDISTGQTLMIGSADMPQFTYDETTGDTVIAYTAGSLAELHTFVYLMCDNSAKPGPPQFFPNGTMDLNLFLLTVFSPCACAGRCDANGLIGSSSKVELSIGTYVCFGLVAVALLYFVVGALIMKFVKKAKGKELIPNSEFWCGLPAAVKKGCMFTLYKCRLSSSYSDM